MESWLAFLFGVSADALATVLTDPVGTDTPANASASATISSSWVMRVNAWLPNITARARNPRVRV